MTKYLNFIWLAAAGVLLVMPAQAQVRDADYLGTLVCGKLPFAQDPTRAAISVKITSNEGPYNRPVHMPIRSKVVGTETGTVKVDGDKIALTGGWKGERASYEASYGGTFVRRSAKLSGTQTWTYDGKKYTRTCSGAIKRPLAAFLEAEDLSLTNRNPSKANWPGDGSSRGWKQRCAHVWNW